MKTFEMQFAVSPQALVIYHGAIVVNDVMFATGADIVADAREAGLAGFHLVCTSSRLFTLLRQILDAGAHVMGTGLVDKRVYSDEWETIGTLRIAIDPAAQDVEPAEG